MMFNFVVEEACFLRNTSLFANLEIQITGKSLFIKNKLNFAEISPHDFYFFVFLFNLYLFVFVF